MSKKINRRGFIQKSAVVSAGLAAFPGVALSAPAITKSGKPKSTLNVGIIGAGLRGQEHLYLLLRHEDCAVPAICDIDQRMIERSLKIYDEQGKPHPKVYGPGERDYRKMLEDPAIDAVIIATPWEWHTEMAMAAMRAEKYVGMEVRGAFSLDECWQLVNTHEATGTPLFFLENVCYRRDVLAILNMVRQGLFGELIHLECGYQHDLRGVKFNDGKTAYNSGAEFGDNAFSEAKWRTKHSVHRNGDLYPTHGIGPAAQCLNINRGNRFLYLTSTSSKARGLHEYVLNHPKGGPDHPNAKVEFRLGDVTTTVIKTVNGESIIISHDTNLPRPYSLGFRVQGTKGLWMDLNKSIHLEGQSPEHAWEPAKQYLDRYDHHLWKKYADRAEGAGHDGIDWFLINAFVESALRGEKPPIDVYDAASWMAITPLSEQSIALGSQPMPFPDFTRGRWTEWGNDFGVGGY